MARNNFNIMYRALGTAHNLNNRKVIDKKLCNEVGINDLALADWVKDVKALQDTIEAYVRAKHDKNADKKQVSKLRNKIFPLYKEILEQGERTSDSHELFMSEHDVDSLVGYCEAFAKSEHGTVQVIASEQAFRKQLESLIGCKMAGNAVLTNEDRDGLSAHYGAMHSLKKLERDLEELEKQIKANTNLIAKMPAENEEAKKVVRASLIAPLEKQKTELESKIITAKKAVEDGKAGFDEINSRIRFGECADMVIEEEETEDETEE